MNIQEAFDRASQGVIDQGFMSLSAERGCCYKTGNLKCGVGHLLLDDEMCERWDRKGFAIISLMACMPVQALNDLKDSGLDQLPLQFLSDVQVAHDKAETLSEFKRHMIGVAVDWGLTCTFS